LPADKVHAANLAITRIRARARKIAPFPDEALRRPLFLLFLSVFHSAGIIVRYIPDGYSAFRGEERKDFQSVLTLIRHIFLTPIVPRRERFDSKADLVSRFFFFLFFFFYSICSSIYRRHCRASGFWISCFIIQVRCSRCSYRPLFRMVLRSRLGTIISARSPRFASPLASETRVRYAIYRAPFANDRISYSPRYRVAASS